MITVVRHMMLTGLIAAAGTVPSVVVAQDGSNAGLAYGRGVHAYFAGRSDAAERELSLAIQENPHDPRPYYFRGLSLLRLGRNEEARNEMMIGGELEARQPGRYAIGKSLERVQGSHRLLLEDHRRRARAADAEQRSERHRQRYESTRDREADVLRQRVSVPLEQLMEPGPATHWTQGAAGPEPPQELSPWSASAEPVDDPFIDDPQPSRAMDASAADRFSVDDGTTATAESASADVDGGKIPSGKLLGVLGRVLRSSAPVPSWERLRGQVPFLPGADVDGHDVDAPETFDAESDEFFADDAEPFGFDEPSSPATDAATDIDVEPSALDAEDEDPFEGF